MKEHPILFSAPMVRALLAGRKTQTRRVVKPQPWDVTEEAAWKLWHNEPTPIPCPYGQPGDRLWVRETWHTSAEQAGVKPSRLLSEWGGHGLPPICYHADSADNGCGSLALSGGWDQRGRPSIFMPRWASRLTLELTSVRVERVQAITEEDALQEGVDLAEWGDGYPDEDPREVGYPSAAASLAHANTTYSRAFSRLWDSINAARGYPWSADPWVWVVGFRRAS